MNINASSIKPTAKEKKVVSTEVEKFLKNFNQIVENNPPEIAFVIWDIIRDQMKGIVPALMIGSAISLMKRSQKNTKAKRRKK